VLQLEYPRSIFNCQHSLALSYPEHLCPTHRTHTLSCQLAILHRYCLWVFHFSFHTTFHTICFHGSPPFSS
jgi:hypothetical protein